VLFGLLLLVLPQKAEAFNCEHPQGSSFHSYISSWWITLDCPSLSARRPPVALLLASCKSRRATSSVYATFNPLTSRAYWARCALQVAKLACTVSHMLVCFFPLHITGCAEQLWLPKGGRCRDLPHVSDPGCRTTRPGVLPQTSWCVCNEGFYWSGRDHKCLGK
jgi:hypothetical protein